MAEGSVLKAVRYLGKCLEENGLFVTKIILFGSQAEGTAREDSDIDIVIISSGFEGKDVFERAAMLRKARLKTIDRFLLPMDIILKTPEEFEDSLISLYTNAGKVVFKSAIRRKSGREKASA